MPRPEAQTPFNPPKTLVEVIHDLNAQIEALAKRVEKLEKK